ncbi:Synapsin, ATP binding domain containing protein [Histomonas meleagridis]|uniref:Synapsin, ATP binding domain containing protein n=1 Tax=Histomonas meleagridis TaxID=135588 RepID=UPI003559E218|nr:Synapsin, ATP binding domain containing protein [Histomonas meleagridis]KAH0804351.1 Synapsin, ATP binding domain containing protein [Histomonas meleagridis]
MEKKIPTVLVVANPHENWYKLCQDYADVFNVEQACWEDISLTSYPTKVMVNLTASKYPIHESQKKRRTISPDLVVVRMLCRYIGRLGTSPDYRNVLYGFMHANIPMINSFSALLCEIDRPLMVGRLKLIQKRLGKENFPVIPQHYYSQSQEMIITPQSPYVLKVSYPHAGYGKMRINNSDQMDDIKSVLHLHHDYISAEPFINSEYEVRIVYIAPDYYRAHKRKSFEWKVNYGVTNEREDIEMTPKYKMWVDAIKNTFPDMDTFCIDSIIDKEGKEYILEVNGSAQGFAPEHNDEELAKMRELVMRKLKLIEENNENGEKKLMLESEKDLEILNLKNKNTFLETKIENLERRNKMIQSDGPIPEEEGDGNVLVYGLIAVLAALVLFQFFLMWKRQ